MKKVLSAAILFALILSSLVICPAEALTAGDLPYDNVPPTHLAAVWLEGGDSPTTMALSLTIDNSMAEFYMAKEQSWETDHDAFMAQYPFDDIWTEVQIDWALDDVNDEVSGWHYTPYWDYHQIEDDYWAIGFDENWNWRCSDWDMVDWGLGNTCYTEQDFWVTRGVSEGSFYGDPDTGKPGIKDQLREDQYTYEVEEEGEEPVFRIDYNEHTIYFRARLYTVLRYWNGEELIDDYIFTDWSEPCAYGKDAEKIEPLKPGDVDAPVITGLTNLGILEDNDFPTVAFTLTVPDKLAEQAANQSVLGLYLYIEVWARVVGDAEFVALGDYDRDITPGEHRADLGALCNEQRPIITVDAKIELKCRYAYDCDDPYTGWEFYYSDWSKIITFGGDDVGGYGDVNGDGRVDGKDLIRLRKYLSGENVAITEGANVNGDAAGEVNGKDIIRLRKYLASNDPSLLGPQT